MNNFKSQNYAKSVKKLMPQGKRLRKDGLGLVCSIIYEINSDFINTILQRAKHITEIRSENIEECIKPLIPRGLKTIASSAGKNAVLKFQSGELTYDIPKPHKMGLLEPRMLRKGLEELTKVAHCNLSLSKDCSTISGIIQRLAMFLSDLVTEAARNKPDHALEIYRETIMNVVGDELSFHVEGHAENNLNWYKIGRLEFDLKSPKSESVLEFARCPIFTKGIQKLARGCFGASLTKYATVKIETSLMAVLEKVMENAKEGIQPQLIEFTTVTEFNVYRTVKHLLPQSLFRHAGSHAQDNVMKYSFGDLRYEYIRPSKKECVPEDELQVTANGPIKLNCKKTIKSMLQGQCISAEKGFLSCMNDMLNDLCHAVAAKCSENVQKNDDDLTMHDVILSVSNLLPKGLMRCAVARIAPNVLENCYVHRIPQNIRTEENCMQSLHQKIAPESISSSGNVMKWVESMEIDGAVNGTSQNGTGVGAKQNHEKESAIPTRKESLGSRTNQAKLAMEIDDAVMDTTGPEILESEVQKVKNAAEVRAKPSHEKESMTKEQKIETETSTNQAKNSIEHGAKKSYEQDIIANTKQEQSKNSKDRILPDSKDERMEIENVVDRIAHETSSNIDLEAKKSHEQENINSTEQGKLESSVNQDVMDDHELGESVEAIDMLSPEELKLFLHDIPRVIYWLDIRPYEML